MKKVDRDIMWDALKKDDIASFKRHVIDDHAYMVFSVKLSSWSGDDSSSSARRRSLLEICAIGKACVPEGGAVRILNDILSRFYHLVKVDEVVKSIRIAQYKKRDLVVKSLLDFMNVHFINVHGFEDKQKQWIMADNVNEPMNRTVGYFVSFHLNQAWMSYDAYPSRPQLCPLTLKPIFPTIILKCSSLPPRI